MTSKVQFVGLPLRYNIFNDQVEFRTKDETVQVLSVPEVIEKVEFGQTTLEYSVYSNLNKIKRGFFVVLEKGKATLYSRPRVNFEDAKKAAAYSMPNVRFIKGLNEYYIAWEKPAELIARKKI